MADPRRVAEDYPDYRGFRFLALNGARLVAACLFLLGWHFLMNPPGSTRIFLASTAGLSLAVSLLSALVAYLLYRARGGRVERTRPPVP